LAITHQIQTLGHAVLPYARPFKETWRECEPTRQLTREIGAFLRRCGQPNALAIVNAGRAAARRPFAVYRLRKLTLAKSINLRWRSNNAARRLSLQSGQAKYAQAGETPAQHRPGRRFWNARD
jgi:hypothetical protein